VKILALINFCGLFYDAITIRHDATLNGRMTDESGRTYGMPNERNILFALRDSGKPQ
jgi:hypothetical protein